MWIYFFILFISSFLALSFKKTSGNIFRNSSSDLGLIIFGFFLTIFIGLRDYVGADWDIYLEAYNNATYFGPSGDYERGGDLAYNFLNWLSSNIGGGIYLVNSLCALIFVGSIVNFAKTTNNPWLCMVIAFPYLVIVVGMGYTRQSVAIGLLLSGIAAFEKGSVSKFIFFSFIACLFHKTALILLPLVLLSGRSNLLSILGAFVFMFVFYFYLMSEQIDILFNGYLQSTYKSSGAGIRISMNLLPALILLYRRKNYTVNQNIGSFWIWMSVSSIAYVPLLFIIPDSSTAVDRMALYWIPLQLFVLANVPTIFGKTKSEDFILRIFVVCYSFAVLFVWVFYADNSSAWIPYRINFGF